MLHSAQLQGKHPKGPLSRSWEHREKSTEIESRWTLLLQQTNRVGKNDLPAFPR